MKALALSLLCLCAVGALLNSALSQSYSFTTIAGLVGNGGTADGTNTDARFYFPAGVAVDDAGVVYVADLLNHTVRRVAPLGTNWVVSTIAGLARTRGSANGTNSDARFDHPMGIKVDHTGNVFVTDKYNDTIRKITPQGTNWIVTTIAGSPGVQASDNGTNSDAHFWGPSGVDIDDAKGLFVVDSSNFTIRGIDSQGTNWVVSTLAGTPLAYGFQDGTNGDAMFDYPYNVAFAGVGNLFVTDWGNQSIRQITSVGPDWSTVTIAGFSGTFGTNDGLAATADFNSPTGIAVDAQTNVFVTDYGSHTIRKVQQTNAGWFVSTIGGAPMQFGSTNGVGNAARFNRPFGIALDRSGNLFIADYSNQTIRKGTPLPPPIPVLQIARTGTQIVLAWPAAASNYILETSSTLGPSSWMSLTNRVVLSSDNYWFTNDVSQMTAFFRLRQSP
jgi:hypothetical protein